MRLLIPIVALIAFVLGCSQQPKEKTSTESWSKVSIKYAQHFELFKRNNTFKVVLLDPESRETLQTLEIKSNDDNRVICLTASLTGMFCALNRRSSIIGVTAENQLFDAELRRGVKKGNIKEFGDFAQVSMERVIDSSPDVILYNYVTQEFPNQKKLENLGIDILIVNDWLEAHPLARAEWIKVIGAITGKFDEACLHFDRIESRYLSLSAKVSNLDSRPTVLSGNIIGGTWYAPSGENYFGILIHDAGGHYTYNESTGTQSLALPLEKILKDNITTEIWLNPGAPSLQEVLDINPHASALSAFPNRVYCYTANVNKFWEQSATRPDYVLEDLIAIFHPEENDEFSFHFYAPLKK
jgi:iron complex transport system substrate-binding protein